MASCSVQVSAEERGNGGLGGWGLQLLVCQLAVWLSICRFRLYTVLATKIGLRLCLRSAIRVNVSMIFLIIYCLFFSLFFFTQHTESLKRGGRGEGVCAAGADLRAVYKLVWGHTQNMHNLQCKQCWPSD